MPPPPRSTQPPMGDRGEDLGDDEPVTNPRIALGSIEDPNKVDVEKVHAYLAEKRAELETELRENARAAAAAADEVKKQLLLERAADAASWLGKFKALAAAVVVVAGGVVAVLIFVDNRVQAQTDAGVKVHEARIGNLEQQRAADRGENNARFERLEAGQARTDAKLDAILDRLRVPNPAPTPKDGGP